MSTYYKIPLEGINITGTSFFFTCIAGELKLQITGSWDTVLQYQYDLIQSRLKRMANSQPLKEADSYNRDYDYIEYYDVLYGTDLSAWLATSPVLPLDIVNLPPSSQLQILQDRITLCHGLKPVIEKYKEGLRWNVVVEDEQGVKTSAVIQPGGWFRNQANDYSFIFLSTKEYIGKDDLPYVYLFVEIKDV